MNNKAIQPAITLSIVLFRPDLPALERLICSIQPALTDNISGDAFAFPAEVVLIDHSDASLSSVFLERLRGLTDTALAIRYLHTKANPGFGAGHNRAFEEASSSRYFLVTNPDLEFLPESLACAIQYLDSHPDTGLLAPALCEQPDNIRPACFRYPDVLTLLARFIGGTFAAKRSYRYECRDWEPATLRADPILVSGCCMFFRSTTYKSLGGFDTSFFLYFEDFDLSMRATRITHSVYHPRVGVKHAGGGAGRKGGRHAWMFLSSARRFFAKHGWRWV